MKNNCKQRTPVANKRSGQHTLRDTQPIADPLWIISKMKRIKIHLIHGSMKRNLKSRNSKRLLGPLGGHVLIEFDNTLFEFTFNQKKIKLFPNIEKSVGVINKISKDRFEAFGHWEKITTYEIRIPDKSKMKIEYWLNLYSKRCPFDYAIFGDRCCSIHYKTICKAGVSKNTLLGKIIAQIPILYIHCFKYLIKDDIKYSIARQKGCSTRIWF